MTRQNLKNAGAQMPGTVSVSRLLRGGTLVALALSISGALVGCALVGDGAQSSQSSAGATGISTEQAMSTPTEKIMSGEYEVGPDGKLLNPNRNLNLTPPQLPELAKEHSKEGAEALAQHYVEILPYIHKTGDTSPLWKIAHSDCAFCADVDQKIQKKNAKGAWAKSISYDITHVGPTFEFPDHPGIWNVDLRITRSEAISYDGEKMKKTDGGLEQAHIQMQYENGQWRLWAVGE